MKKLKIILVLCTVFLVAGFFLLKWRVRQVVAENVKERFKTAITHHSSEEQKAEALTHLSEETELEFPPSTKLRFACVFKGDYSDPFEFAVKLEINRSDLDFIYGEINKHSEIYNHSINTADSATWHPPLYFGYYNPENIWQADNVKNKVVYSIIYNAGAGFPVLDILVDLDRPDSTIIYFYYAAI